MKFNKTRIDARRNIALQTFVYVALPFVIFSMGRHIAEYFNYIHTEPSVLYGAILIFGPLTLAMIITALRLSDKADVKLMTKWQERDDEQKRLKEMSDHNTIATISNNYYEIIEVSPSITERGYFTIRFAQPLKHKHSDEIRPDIRMGGAVIPFTTLDKYQVKCYLEKHLKVDTETFTLSCGSASIEVKNPYHITLDPSKICWQNEGHPHEKLIFIDGSCLSYKIDGFPYAFDLLVNGELRGTFHGKYHAVQDKILVKINEVFKKDCAGRECVIRVSCDKRIKAILPQPELFAVNSPVPEFAL